MEFTISCPIDGAIEVSIEDIDTVVLREADHADITFVCPHCGTEITVSAVVPAFLLAAIESLADDPEAQTSTGIVVLSSEATEPAFSLEDIAAVAMDTNDPCHESYCEYFRRQLSHVDCVEDALAEIDAKS